MSPCMKTSESSLSMLSVSVASLKSFVMISKVERIEKEAFWCCGSLKRVIMPGVTIIEEDAFYGCEALTDVECDKLEIIGENAFECCSLGSISLPSIKIVGMRGFFLCTELLDVKFGSELERFDRGAFRSCYSLERITIPLKDGPIPAGQRIGDGEFDVCDSWDVKDGFLKDRSLNDDNSIFAYCENLKHVELIERAALHETIAALHLEVWRNDMNEEIDSINQILPIAPADGGWYDDGEKAEAIAGWIRLVLHKINHYKAEHQRILDGAATALQHALPRDIVMNSILLFLELPSHTFEGENRRVWHE